MDDRNDFEPESAEDVIARARHSEPLAVALPCQPDNREQDAWMDAAFAALDASKLFDPAVLEAVDVLMNDSESVTAHTRQRLVDGADRGVRWRRRLDNHIGNLLRDRRCSLQLTPGDVAAHVRAAAPLVAEIETGAKPIQSLTAEQVAGWIRHVNLAPEVALAALGNTPAPGKRFTSDVAEALGRSHGRR